MRAARMDLKNSLQRLVDDNVVKATDCSMRSPVANFRWEPSVSVDRANDYNDFLSDVETYREWKAEHKSYLSSSVHIAKDLPKSPDCFTEINAQAHIYEDLDDTYLIRLESLGYLLANDLVSDIADQFWNRYFRSQKDLLKTSFSLEEERLRQEFITQWNNTRTESRPLFATFLNDFGGDLKMLIKQDWPHLLRDRLGLTHWPSMPDKALPVALVCYTLDDVRQAREKDIRKGATASFSRPTVLDAEMSAAFVPAPLTKQNQSYGYTLDLQCINSIPDNFTPELLTYPIEYKSHHVKALGYINQSHELYKDDAILQARNFHIQGLQIFTGEENFGEVLK